MLTQHMISKQFLNHHSKSMFLQHLCNLQVRRKKILKSRKQWPFLHKCKSRLITIDLFKSRERGPLHILFMCSHACSMCIINYQLAGLSQVYRFYRLIPTKGWRINRLEIRRSIVEKSHLYTCDNREKLPNKQVLSSNNVGL